MLCSKNAKLGFVWSQSSRAGVPGTWKGSLWRSMVLDSVLGADELGTMLLKEDLL